MNEKIENIFAYILDGTKPEHSWVLRIRRWFRNKYETSVVNLIPKITDGTQTTLLPINYKSVNGSI